MKNLIIFILAIGLLIYSCNSQESNYNKSSHAYMVFGNDTVNKTDPEGRKQGVWIIFDEKSGKNSVIKDTIIYKDNNVISE